MIVAPRHSEHMLTSWAILLHLVGKRACQRSHTPQHGHEPEIPISALRTSHMSYGVQNVIGIPILSRKVWCTKLSGSHQDVSVRCSHNIHRRCCSRGLHIERCIKDVSLLRSSEDTPRTTDPVRIIAYNIFQLGLSLGTYWNRELQHELFIYNTFAKTI